MSSQENKRTPNKPTLFLTSKKTTTNKNTKKHNVFSSSGKINTHRNLSEVYFDVYALHPNQKEKSKIYFSNESTFQNEHESPTKISLYEKIENPDQIGFDKKEGKENRLILSQSLNQNSEIQNINNYNTFPEVDDNMNSKLGEKIRIIFDGITDNDSIAYDIKILIKFIKSIKSSFTTENNNSIESIITELKKNFFKYDEIVTRNEDLENSIIQYKNILNADDQNLLKIVKSFYNNCSNSKEISEIIEKDLTFSKTVKNIFNEYDNDEAVLRTIQSNKETANDNQIILDLTAQLQQLNEKAEINREVIIQNRLIEKVKIEHIQKINEKDSMIEKLIQSINGLNKQIENLNSIIERNHHELEEEKMKFEIEREKNNLLKSQNMSETDQKLNNLKEKYENQLSKYKEELSKKENIIKMNEEKISLIDQIEIEINHIKKENNVQKNLIDQKETEINHYKEVLDNKELLTDQLRNDLFNQQRINEQNIKENKELKNFIKNGEDIKDKEILYLKKELLSSLDKQKKIEDQLEKLTKKYEVAQSQTSSNKKT